MTRHFLWLFIVVRVGCSNLQLEVPDAGNCMDTTTLTCTRTQGSLGTMTLWRKTIEDIDLNIFIGTVATNHVPDRTRYGAYRKDNKYFLEINNTMLEDAGEYNCVDGFYHSDDNELKFECKARTVKVAGQADWKLIITADEIYPSNPTFIVTTILNGHVSNHAGTLSSAQSQTDENLFSVRWISLNSLNAVGEYHYNVTVTTITPSQPFVGRVKFVLPSKPIIENNVSLTDRVVLNGVEEQRLTISCKSKGGYPETDMAWQKGSATTRFGNTQGKKDSDGTYTVTITHTFTPKRIDDLVKFTCKSFYPVAGDVQRTNFAILYLKLKPTYPSVSQIRTVSAGDTAHIRCETSQARPAADIVWEYSGNTISPRSTITENKTSETFSTISILNLPVQREDNGKTVKCIVSHQTLSQPLATSTTVSVQFPPLNVSLSGNKQVIANGFNILTLTCNTDSANPVANVEWSVPDADIITSTVQTNHSGSYAGRVTTGSIQLKPTRHNDGNEIWCLASNSINRENPVKQKIALNLLYSPEVTTFEPSSKLVNESDTNVAFHCSAQSKPTSNFTWYHNGNELPRNKILQRENNSSYTIQLVDRTDYDIYTCKASNHISPEGEKSFTLHIQFGPRHVSITGNNAIVADGNNWLTLVCKADSSNPAATLIWRNGTNQLQSTAYNTTTGLHGGKISYQSLSFRPTRYMNNSEIFCEGSNSLIGSSLVRGSAILSFFYHPISTALEGPHLTVTEGQPSISLRCVADSNPVSNTIKWYKGNSTGPVKIRQSSNELAYIIAEVNREHAGDYRCTAENGIPPSDSENGQVKLVVQYPPSITVKTINATINASNVEIICVADGLPSNYKFSKWKHLWAETYELIRAELPYARTETSSKQIVNVTSLSYQDTGIYACGAGNGVKLWGTNIDEIVNSVYLLVQSYPIITSEEHDKGTSKIIPRLNKQFALSVSFYSNADNTEAFLYRKINATVERYTTYERVNNASLDIKDSEVELSVYGQRIRTPGYLLTLKHTFYSTSEYGLYSLKIMNDIGTTEVFFITIQESAPCTPVSPAIDGVEDNVITVSWIRCFHGGFAQAFIIQYRKTGYAWNNGTVKEGGLSTSKKRINSTISNLQPATIYFIRMFAYNRIGRSDFTETIHATTKPKGEDTTTSSSVGPIAGGAAASVVLATVIVVLIILLLRRRKCYLKLLGKGLPKDNNSSGSKAYEDLRCAENPANVYDIMNGRNDCRETRFNAEMYEDLRANENEPENMYSPLNEDTGKRGAAAEAVYSNLKIYNT